MPISSSSKACRGDTVFFGAALWKLQSWADLLSFDLYPDIFTHHFHKAIPRNQEYAIFRVFC
jgi:hypothetical protein